MGRSNVDLELLVRLDQSSSVPLRGQLREQLRAAARDARLRPGVQLPSTRVLARRLGVSRGVVVDAYEQLVAEGYLVSRSGAGTSVTDLPAAASWTGDEQPAAARAPMCDLRPGAGALSQFPRDAWQAAERRVMRHVPDDRLNYGDPAGAPELRGALADYLGRVRGVSASDRQVVVVSGFAQGLGLIGRALYATGVRRLAVEDPSHVEARRQLAAGGLELVPVPVDDSGIVMDALRDTDADAVMLTPAHQFPTGVALTADRRAELLAWADRSGTILVEDDYDAEYRYDRQPVGALQGLRPDLVIYGGSVSKTLAPALRLGWLVLPAPLVDAVIELKRLDDLGSPTLPQLALAEFLRQGDFDRHLRRTRRIYRCRRDALLLALGEHLPEVRPLGIAAGLHLSVLLPVGTDELAVATLAARRSVAVGSMGEHRLTPGCPALLLGYARHAEDTLEYAVRELATAMS
jgi:GntR family transcriptional regulator/MocR family aminotransferase